jgi:tryptophan halogenase
VHQLLGLDEDDVLSATSGLYSLAQRFVGWSGSAPPFMHPYDGFGTAFDNVDFVHYWLRAGRRGLPLPLEAFSLAASAAKQGRIVVHNDESEAISKAAHGYQLDARSYARFLAGHALRSGVEARGGPVTAVDAVDGRISSVTLADGMQLRADLFVDASAEGVLIADALGAGFEPWDAWLPADRILSVSAKRLNTLATFSQISAMDVGWVGAFPLQDRTAVTAVYSSAYASDQQVLEAIGRTGMGASGDATVQAFRAGIRPTPWIGNCVAVGEAAARLEPADAAPMQLLQVALAHLVALFPVDADKLAEAQIYNRAIRAHAENIRDFQIAHYKLNGRTGEPLWDRARAAAAPAGLAYKLKLFGARGRVPMYDDESFSDSSWTAIFVGHGVTPRAYDPLADRVADEELPPKLQDLLDFIAQRMTEMPSAEAQLEMFMPSQGSGFF